MNSERIFLFLVAAALIAVVIWNVKAPPSGMLTLADEHVPPETPLSRKQGPLTYNQPYLFSPPVANVLPRQAFGVGGADWPNSDNVQEA